MVAQNAVADYAVTARPQWMLKWPGMLVLSASQIYWTREVAESIRSGGYAGLAAYEEKCSSQLQDLVKLVIIKTRKPNSLCSNVISPTQEVGRKTLNRLEIGLSERNLHSYVAHPMRTRLHRRYTTSSLQLTSAGPQTSLYDLPDRILFRRS